MIYADSFHTFWLAPGHGSNFDVNSHILGGVGGLYTDVQGKLVTSKAWTTSLVPIPSTCLLPFLEKHISRKGSTKYGFGAKFNRGTNLR